MRSFRYKIIEAGVRLSGYKKVFSLDKAGLTAYIEKRRSKRKTAPPRFIYKRHQVEELTAYGRPCYVVSPAGGMPSEKAVLFLHGGGMFMEALVLHWMVVSKLVRRLGATVWIPAYPLIPGCTFRDVTEMLLTVYTEMLEKHPAEEITYLGDSAGAALALMLCHHNKTLPDPQPMPGRLILVSPGMMTGEDQKIWDEMHRILPHDPMLSVEFTDAMASIMHLSSDKNDYFSVPFYGDFSGFPETHIFSGTYEVFYAQIPALVERIQAAGTPVTLYSGERMMHVWPHIPFVPESGKALEQIFELIG